MAQTLEQRLSSASQSNRINLTDLEQLIGDTVAERDAQAAQHVSASAEAVNFRLAESDRDEAAKRAERASRNAAALDGAIVELETKLRVRRESDNRASIEAERTAAVNERNAVAERIRKEWPVMAGQIVSLFESIEASDARLAACGSKEPSAEAVARGCAANFYDHGYPIKRLTKIQLPELDSVNLAWPTTAPRYAAQPAIVTAAPSAPKSFKLSSGHPGVIVYDVATIDGPVSIDHRVTQHRLDQDMLIAATAKRVRIEPTASQ